MSSPKNLYNQSETLVIQRSQVNFAPYNPRVDDPEVVKTLRRNFKKVGFLGGIVWNAITSNLVSGHKRVKGLDLIHRYDGTPERDYDIKVEMIEIDETTEKEQNIFMNADSAQGDFDMKMLAEILPGIDYKSAGLTDEDIDMIELEVPDFDFGESQAILEDIENDSAPLLEEKKEQVEKRREERAKRADYSPNFKQEPIEDSSQRSTWQKEGKEKMSFENSVKTYVTLSFSSAENKLAFMNRFGLDATQEFVKGEHFSDMVERVE